MEKHIPPLNVRPFLKACKRMFGMSVMVKLFNISERTFFSWSAIEAHVSEESVRENYLEKHERLLAMLMEEPEGVELARGIVSKHAHVVGCNLAVQVLAIPDKATIEAECLDDYPELIRFHDAIRNDKEVPVVEYLADQVIREVNETLEKYKSATR